MRDDNVDLAIVEDPPKPPTRRPDRPRTAETDRAQWMNDGSRLANLVGEPAFETEGELGVEPGEVGACLGEGSEEGFDSAV